MTPFKIERLGLIMEPQPGVEAEAGGVLNPAAARGRDGQLYLFPRLVGPNNYSRIGIARVLFDKAGDPSGVERMGVVLEPEAEYEKWPDGRGGCEDPRVTYIPARGHYVMTYTAFSAAGPRIAFAVSEDLMSWRRMGLAHYHDYKDLSFDNVDDKDGSVFSALVDDPDGKASIALLHRPLFPGSRPEEMVDPSIAEPEHPDSQCMWLSYWHVDAESGLPKSVRFVAHRRLARPEAAWERLKIGGGAPPVLCRHGWLLLYHGVQSAPNSSDSHPKFIYSAGAMVLDIERPHRILYRSPEPILSPDGALETAGVVDGVVFPTGVDRRDDIGQPDRIDVYYGMADDRIGVGRLTVPKALE